MAGAARASTVVAARAIQLRALLFNRLSVLI
jgi:hypothetical protein